MQEQQYQLNSAVAEQREVSGVLRITPPNGELDYMNNTDMYLFFETVSSSWIVEHGAEIFIDEDGVIMINYQRVFTDELIVYDGVKLSPD